MTRRHLVLVGMMGSGKSTVGERCAGRLGRPFVDTDALLEAVHGETIATLLDDVGMERFRELEAATVADVAAAPDSAVIACGGGVVERPDNVAVLRRRGTVVWLRAAPAELARRVGDGAGRPLLAHGPVEPTLARLAERRAPLYARAAHAVVDTDGRPVDEVVDDVLAVLRAEERAS